MIRVQEHDFSVEEEYQKLRAPRITGAIVHFIGTVRDFSSPPLNTSTTEQDLNSSTFLLQHYPGMTETVLEKIECEARHRWNLINTAIIHRVGRLNIDDQIVFVGASSAHRESAFAACQFMIDILKTEAPFWKKEGTQWVQAKDSDRLNADRWIKAE